MCKVALFKTRCGVQGNSSSVKRSIEKKIYNWWLVRPDDKDIAVKKKDDKGRDQPKRIYGCITYNWRVPISF